MATLSDKQVAFLKDLNFGVVATLGDDGTPQTTAVWIDTDGENVLFNTKRGRAKVDHLEADPRVSVIVLNHENPYSWLSVEGVASLEEGEKAVEHIHMLANKYTGADFSDLEGRVMVRVKPERVHTYQFD